MGMSTHIEGFMPAIDPTYLKHKEVLLVCHSCDNPVCTNPEHLFLGTQSKNMIDCQIKNRSSKNKLQQEDVIDIINLFKNGKLNYDLAKTYNVNITTINNILSGRTWSFLTNIKNKSK